MRSSGLTLNKIEILKLKDEGRHKFGEFVVRKIFGNQNEINRDRLELYNKLAQTEFTILHENQHPNLVMVFADSLELSDPDRPIFQQKLPRFYMELADSSLRYAIRQRDIYPNGSSYTLGHVTSWLLQAATGLRFLHAMGLMHRDVKALNMLLFRRGTTLKLCDLELGRDCQVNMTADRGTEGWKAPEVFAVVGRDEHGKQIANYGSPADCYSLSRVMLELLFRDLPPNGEPNWDNCVFADLPDGLKALQSQAMDIQPENRPSADEICTRLKALGASHPAPELICDSVDVHDVTDTGLRLDRHIIDLPRDAFQTSNEQKFRITYCTVCLEPDALRTTIDALNSRNSEVLSCLASGSGCSLNSQSNFVQFLVHPPDPELIVLRLNRSSLLEDNFTADARLIEFLSGEILAMLLLSLVQIPLS